MNMQLRAVAPADKAAPFLDLSIFKRLRRLLAAKAKKLNAAFEACGGEFRGL